ncbi:MAG TPA: hypothetical protein VES42_01195 [Pilimelia sp.]|nr:hypothetical protein [Pilimelia sp.]
MRRHLWTAPAALAATLLLAVTVAPAATADEGDDPPAVPRPAVTLRMESVWPHQQICTKGEFTTYSAERPRASAGVRVELSLTGRIGPCTGESAAGAAYDFVHYSGPDGVLLGSGTPLGARQGFTSFQGRYTGVGSQWALCLIDYAHGTAVRVEVSKVACLAVETEAGSGRSVVRQIPVTDPRVMVPVRKWRFPTEEQNGFCGNCL